MTPGGLRIECWLIAKHSLDCIETKLQIQLCLRRTGHYTLKGMHDAGYDMYLGADTGAYKTLGIS